MFWGTVHQNEDFWGTGPLFFEMEDFWERGGFKRLVNILHYFQPYIANWDSLGQSRELRITKVIDAHRYHFSGSGDR